MRWNPLWCRKAFRNRPRPLICGIRWLILCLTTLPGFPALSADPVWITLAPTAMSSQSGRTVGSLSALVVMDQSGTQNTSGRYVSFTTPGTVYKGYRSYGLSSAIQPAWVGQMQIKANYYGPAKASQAWSWYLYHWGNRTWTKIGDNAAALSNRWTLLSFNVATGAPFIGANGEIRLQLRSATATYDARLDYEAISLTYTEPAAPDGEAPTLGGCPVFPADNYWNRPIDDLPVHAKSSAWIDAIGRSKGFHMDFGSGTWDGGPIGIPYNILDGGSVNHYNVNFYYDDESDPGPYPIPANPLIEWGSDHHLLVIDTRDCHLYEIYDLSSSGGQWYGGSGAIWDLHSQALRPETWTSADAAGLPMLPGLSRYDEVLAGSINHALRFTSHCTKGYIWPARHQATSGSCTNPPPMGARFRLKASYDISGFSPQAQILLQAMKTYGIVLADNGSDWYVSGAPDDRWNNDVLHELDVVTGNDFEAVDTSVIMLDPNSGEASP